MVNTEIRLIIIFAAEDGKALYNQQKQDQELTVVQIMNSLLKNSDLKKIGKTTRPFRYDLNQIPYNYTVEVIDRVSEELWTEVCDCTGGSDQDHPQKKKCKKAKWLSEEALQIAEERREAKGKGKKERYTHLNAEFQIARRDKKALLSDQ